jgi:uncharacterized protein
MQKTVDQTMETLKVLQSVDDQLAQYREGVAALSLRVDAHKKRVAELEAELQKKTGELQNEEKSSAKKELDIKVIGERVAKLREQLTTLTSNKAYTAMMGEISGHQAESARVEDDALRIMERVEGFKAGLEEVRKQIAEAHEAVKREEAAISGEVRDLSMRIRELTAERQGLYSQLDRMVADKYERIAHSKQGKAVVAVKDGMCQGCHMGLTKQMIARLWAHKELLYCPNCARMVYLEGEVQ